MDVMCSKVLSLNLPRNHGEPLDVRWLRFELGIFRMRAVHAVETL